VSTLKGAQLVGFLEPTAVSPSAFLAPEKGSKEPPTPNPDYAT
jgi:hypothetical protein